MGTLVARRARWLVVGALGLIAAGCGSGTSTVGDGGVGDGGCLEGTPTMGASCSADQHLCDPGNLCCGGAWSCNPTTGTWQLLQGGCACGPLDADLDAPRPDGPTEGSADAPPPDSSGADATPSDGGSCPASCKTSTDCNTCPTGPFGGWSCGPSGVCQFMG